MYYIERHIGNGYVTVTKECEESGNKACGEIKGNENDDREWTVAKMFAFGLA